MKMNSGFLLLLYYGLTCGRGVYAESEHDVKRGLFPYMAFIYYSDPSVVDVTGQRFSRSAVLIRPDWLVTSALGPSLIETGNGFPKKTLLARAGAISIDAKFTLNEDEDEQEREIVQIVRPYNHGATQWWTTDISLMKTLLPFNMTSAVAIKILNNKQELGDTKTCSILVYAKKFGNLTDEKSLMVFYVDMLPPSIDNCGSHFAANTMGCATDSDENKNAVYEPDFCQGNSGGPLVCENEVVGLQTYIGNNCKQPHLYQLLFAWENFITCGINDKCQEESCGNICEVSYKDPPKIEVRTTPPITHDVERDIVDLVNVPSTTTDNITTPTMFTFFTETSAKESETTIITTVNITADELVTPLTTTTTKSTLATTTTVTKLEKTMSWPKVKTTQRIKPKEKNVTSTTIAPKLNWLGEPRLRSWTKEIVAHDRFNEDDPIVETERSVHVAAQQHLAQQHPGANIVKRTRGGGNSNRDMCVFHNTLFGFIVLLYL